MKDKIIVFLNIACIGVGIDTLIQAEHTQVAWGQVVLRLLGFLVIATNGLALVLKLKEEA